jgi:hypothetical protein
MGMIQPLSCLTRAATGVLTEGAASAGPFAAERSTVPGDLRAGIPVLRNVLTLRPARQLSRGGRRKQTCFRDKVLP